MSGKGKVRIIGGIWKRRTLHFPSLPDLRPSPGASRETLFNWLNPKIAESHCLDLFAGSGSLGFEAASRGASRVDLVESHPAACRAMVKSCQTIQAGQSVEVHQQDAIRYLERTGMKYDIVFLDPPFRKNILSLTLETLVRQKRLRESAIVYVEFRSGQSPLSLPEGWTIAHRMHRGSSTSVLINTNSQIQ
ncbi:MAG: 16S rRNA (guanine(966)-N(2))-methyltransferase RsmD [Gammaproteobacteria bacterium]|nr:16S rRNA (guanine(966)-N(2))-methyltransferase RsmD [Gammaproteobacteria bacterium]